MPFVPYVPTATEMETEAQIVAMSGVTDATLRWIVTIYMAGYHASANETAQKVMHAMADMAGLPDKLVPPALQKRVEDMAYQVLEEMVAAEVATTARDGLAGR